MRTVVREEKFDIIVLRVHRNTSIWAGKEDNIKCNTRIKENKELESDNFTLACLPSIN